MTIPYRLPLHRQAYAEAVELIKSGLDRYETALRLDHEIPRETRKKIAAKAARELGQYARSPSGSKPNFSMVLTPEEETWLKNYVNKSAAIHRALRLLIQLEVSAAGNGTEREEQAAEWWNELEPFERLQVIVKIHYGGK